MSFLLSLLVVLHLICWAVALGTWVAAARTRQPSKGMAHAIAAAVVIGIALAANIGGQSSPISSPQNLIALAAMDPPLDWGSWFAVSLPVSALSIVLIWLLLLASYRPARSPTGDGEIAIRPVRAPKERFSAKQWWVAFV